MSYPRAVSVIGYKDSGKTKVVETLVKELTNRGNKVGTLKHTAEDILLDTPGKDTVRHREAGSIATAILHGKSSAFFIDRYMTVQEMVSKLGAIDYIVIEGFKSLDVSAKIIVPKENGEIKELTNGLEIAIVQPKDVKLSYEGPIPILTLEDHEELADVVEEKAFKLLSGLNCKGCGYEECRKMGIALLKGDAKIEDCVGYTPNFMLKVDDSDIPLGPFVQNMVLNTTLGMVSSLKGVGKPKKVELMFEKVE